MISQDSVKIKHFICQIVFSSGMPAFIGEIIALIVASGETLTGPFPWGVGMRNSLDVKI